jgi:trans-2-enoyl-CoA reductase
MDWQKIIEILLKFGISGATITVTLGYIGKQFIEQFLKSRLEKYKNDLNNESLLFRSNLERINAENNIRYQKVFEERAILI